MADIGDLTVGIACDPSELVSGMTVARDQIVQTTTVIQVQEQSWKAFSSSIVGSIAKIVAPVLNLMRAYKQLQIAQVLLTIAQTQAIAPTITLASAMGVLLSPITLILGALALVGAAFYYFTRTADDASASADQSGDSAEKAATKVSALATVWNAIQGSPINEEIFKKVGTAGEEFDTLRTKLGDLRDSLIAPFVDGAAAIAAYLPTLFGVETAADMATAVLRTFNRAIDEVQGFANTAKTSLLAMGLAFATGMSQADAEQYVKAGDAIKTQAAETEKLIAKMEGQREAFKSLREIQEGAQDAAANAAEVGKVGSIFTVEGVDEATRALQQRSAEVILAGKADEDWERQTTALFNALAKQRQGIIDGTIVDKAAAEAKKALAKAEEEAAKKAQKAAEEALAAARKKVDADAKIAMSAAKLSDEIAVLNGEMTKQEAREAELIREGMTGKQAAEIASLEAEKDRLSGKSSKADKPTAFAVRGSKEATSTVMRALNDSNPTEKSMDKSLKSIDKNIVKIATTPANTSSRTLLNLDEA
jgi:hypothetical protein